MAGKAAGVQTILGNGFRAIVTLCREEKTARRKRPKAAVSG